MLEGAEDLEPTDDLVAQTVAVSAASFNHDPLQGLPSRSEGKLLTLLLDTIGETVLGYVLYRYEEEKKQKFFFILQIAVHPDHRGKRLGSVLMRWAVELAENTHPKLASIRLNSLPGGALKFYGPLGFRCLGGALPVDGTWPMELRLPVKEREWIVNAGAGAGTAGADSSPQGTSPRRDG